MSTKLNFTKNFTNKNLSSDSECSVDGSLLKFYRIVMNQSLFDLKRLIDAMDFIDNSIEEPESHKRDFITIFTLLNTYLGVCDTVSKLKEDVNYGKK